MKRSLLLVLLLAPLAACASAQAKAPVESPKLEVPPPPPRLIETMTPSETPLPDPVADLPANPATPRPRPSTPKSDPVKPEPPKTEPPAEQPPVTAPVTPPPPPLPQLRTPSSPDAARQVQEIIDRANGTLRSIDYQALTTDRRAQYDNAKLLIKQAEDAVKAANFDFAKNVAEKAERIAKELQSRYPDPK